MAGHQLHMIKSTSVRRTDSRSASKPILSGDMKHFRSVSLLSSREVSPDIPTVGILKMVHTRARHILHILSRKPECILSLSSSVIRLVIPPSRRSSSKSSTIRIVIMMEHRIYPMSVQMSMGQSPIEDVHSSENTQIQLRVPIDVSSIRSVHSERSNEVSPVRAVRVTIPSISSPRSGTVILSSRRSSLPTRRPFTHEAEFFKYNNNFLL